MSDRRWTQKQGLKTVRQWRSSGQSMSAFAREHGLNPQRLRYWRDQVESASNGVGATVRSEGRATRAIRLVPGVLVGGTPVSVSLSLGIVVHAQSVRELEPAWLAELARALEQVS